MAAAMPELAGVAHRWVDVRGARLHVAELGEGPPVVLLHGWPQHWWCWRDVMPRLAPHARVLAVDLRGFGWSDATPSGYEKEQLAEDLIGVLDALGLERVQLVGHDWGGVVGFLACLRAPERFERFVALNTGHPWLRARPRLAASAWRFAYQWALAAPVLGRGAAASPLVLRTMLRAGTTRHAAVLEAFDSYAEVLAEPARARATQLLYRTFVASEMPAWMRGRYRDRRLTVPLLWLHGRDDIVLRPELIESIAEHADDARLEYVSGVGHFIGEEAPELVADRVAGFFTLRA
jgi:pimeloyl-ACP methyl ester carboxylesterase